MSDRRSGDESEDAPWSDADSITGDDAGSTAGDDGGMDIDPEVAAALCYVVVPLGLFVLASEEDDQFARFHAFQSLFMTVVFTVAWSVAFVVLFFLSVATLGFGAILAAPVALLLGLGSLGYGLYVASRAYQGEWYEVPYVARYAYDQIERRPA